jgi:FtsH-binding integral membrane protein
MMVGPGPVGGPDMIYGSDGYTKAWEWTEEDKLGFIKKVYGILGSQLLFTAFICMLPYASNGVKALVLNAMPLFWICLVVSVLIPCCMMCFYQLARKVPTNYYLLGLFTFCEAYVVATICALVNNAEIVLAAAFMTAGMVMGLTLYAFTTKTDYSSCAGLCWALASTLTVWLLMCLIFGFTSRLAFVLLGVLIFSIYIVIDTQLILGGGRSYLDKDDYILGAMILYIDII